MTYKALEDYFLKVNMKDKTMELDNQYEEPLTSVYFQISTPAVEHYPKHEHTVRLEWQEGASWTDLLWEIIKVLECQYGYSIKEKVFYKVAHDLVIQSEEEAGNPELAKQMFVKEVPSGKDLS